MWRIWWLSPLLFSAARGATPLSSFSRLLPRVAVGSIGYRVVRVGLALWVPFASGGSSYALRALTLFFSCSFFSLAGVRFLSRRDEEAEVLFYGSSSFPTTAFMIDGDKPFFSFLSAGE